MSRRVDLRVIVAARDEAASVGSCLAALRASVGAQIDVTVVAHRCVDQTAAIARAAGAHVVDCHDDGGKLAAVRAGLVHVIAVGGAVCAAHPVALVDADVAVGPRTLADLVAALRPGVLAACPPLAPRPPRRRTPLAWALHRYNATRGFSSARRWLSGRCVTLAWLTVPSARELLARGPARMRADDIWLSRAVLARGGEGAIVHVDTDPVWFRAPETLRGMQQTWRRQRRELAACASLFPELPAPPPRTPDLLERPADRVAYALFQAGLAFCWAADRFDHDRGDDGWPVVAESKG